MQTLPQQICGAVMHCEGVCAGVKTSPRRMRNSTPLNGLIANKLLASCLKRQFLEQVSKRAASDNYGLENLDENLCVFSRSHYIP